MSRNFLLADALSSVSNIRNSYSKRTIHIPHSRFCFGVLSVMKKYGYIEDICTKEIRSGVKQDSVKIKFDENGANALSSVSILSKPGCRVYFDFNKIKALTVKDRGGLVIVSTSSGVMSGSEAIKKRIGGEVVCIIS